MAPAATMTLSAAQVRRCVQLLRLLITRDIWQDVEDKLEQTCIGPHLKQFFAGDDLDELIKNCKAHLILTATNCWGGYLLKMCLNF